jgi:hypothetical protein
MKLQASCILDYGYINLPISVLEMYKDKEFPLYFKITGNTGMNIIIGVKDFNTKDIIEIPKWLAIYLDVQNNEYIDVELSKQPLLSNYVKFEPQEEELFNIPDYDKHLEKELSNFSTLKIDCVFNININNKDYHFKVLELEPDWFLISDDKYDKDINCLSLINIDLNVDIHNKFLKDVKNIKDIKDIKDINNNNNPKDNINLNELREKRLKYFLKNS